jgi:hypothetical protein
VPVAGYFEMGGDDIGPLADLKTAIEDPYNLLAVIQGGTGEAWPSLSSSPEEHQFMIEEHIFSISGA